MNYSIIISIGVLLFYAWAVSESWNLIGRHTDMFERKGIVFKLLKLFFACIIAFLYGAIKIAIGIVKFIAYISTK